MKVYARDRKLYIEAMDAPDARTVISALTRALERHMDRARELGRAAKFAAHPRRRMVKRARELELEATGHRAFARDIRRVLSRLMMVATTGDLA